MFRLCEERPPTLLEVISWMEKMQAEWIRERGVGRRTVRSRTLDAYRRAHEVALDMASFKHNGGARYRNQWRDLAEKLYAIHLAMTFLRY